MTGILKVDQWKDSGDNALMTSDGAGNLTANAAFSGTLNAGIISINNASTQGRLNVSNNGAEQLEVFPGDASNKVTLQAFNRSTSTSNSFRYFALTHEFTTSGSERMVIDSNGQVSKPAQSSFRAGRSGNYTPGAGADIIFNTVGGGDHYNIGNDYNTSNGRFTAPAAGRYLFITQVLWGPSIADGTNMVDSIRFTTNGVERTFGSRRAYYRNSYTGDGGYFADFTTDIFNLNTNDYVTVRAKKGNSVHGNDQYTIFTGYFLG